MTEPIAGRPGVRRRVAIVFAGDRETRRTATPENNRLALVFREFAKLGVDAEPAVYHDDFGDEVRAQLLRVDAALVWVNPIEEGRDRTRLDAMLRDVSAAGVFVSTHPDVILMIGTKEVVYRTRELGWGSDTHLYTSVQQLRESLPARLAAGEPRVLKQIRGNGGLGVWKVELATADGAALGPGVAPASLARTDSRVRVRHAARGSVEEELTLGQFLTRCEQYFSAGDGKMLDQVYQPRLPDGMIRCYLVHDRVAGFGHQQINALYPAPPGAGPDKAPQPGPRLYHPPSKPEFQALKRTLEGECVPGLQRLLGIEATSLPILWDCDFLLGPRDPAGNDTYVLCEINVSCVAPFPDSAAPYIAAATLARIESTPTQPSVTGEDDRWSSSP